MSKFYSLPIIALQTECADTTSVTFGVSDTLQSTFGFKAGQYLTLKLQINGEEIRRSYSMSSAPHAGNLTITVKKVKNGMASTYLTQDAKVGDILEVMAPEGRFTPTIDPDTGKSYYFFAAGSGITPIMSIIRTLLEEEPLSTLHLLYASRDEACIIFEEALEKLTEHYADQLILEHVISQPKKIKAKGLGSWLKKSISTWTGKSGRIDTRMVVDFLNEHPLRGKSAEYFLCGPVGFMETISTSLMGHGVDSSNIHKEFFTDAGVDKSPVTGAGGAVVQAQLAYTLDGEEKQITVPVGKTILETLLDAKIDAPFSCQSGACSTCMAKVDSGSVNMDTCLALDDDEVANGYILACQSRPTSEAIKINFDI